MVHTQQGAYINIKDDTMCTLWTTDDNCPLMLRIRHFAESKRLGLARGAVEEISSKDCVAERGAVEGILSEDFFADFLSEPAGSEQWFFGGPPK